MTTRRSLSCPVPPAAPFSGPLASAIPAAMRVYAIKPQGLDDGAEPCRTIREMAEYSIGVMRAVRPQGPYLVAGYSAGGLVASKSPSN